MGAIRIRTERVNEEIAIHISMQNCKSIVAMVFECYFFITSSCFVMYVYTCMYNTLLEMMMSVLQEIKGLTKEL